MSAAYLGSISIVTTAWPSTSSTSEMSPALTPEMFTVWPWPGVTACAVESSALSSNALVAEERDPRRIGLLLLGEDVAGDREAEEDQRR